MNEYNPKTSWLEYFLLIGFCTFIFLMLVNMKSLYQILYNKEFRLVFQRTNILIGYNLPIDSHYILNKYKVSELFITNLI